MLSPTAVLYLRDGYSELAPGAPAGGSGLSAGAIAGIALGAVAAAAACAAALWLLLGGRRRRLRRPGGVEGGVASVAGVGGSAQAELHPKPGADSWQLSTAARARAPIPSPSPSPNGRCHPPPAPAPSASGAPLWAAMRAGSGAPTAASPFAALTGQPFTRCSSSGGSSETAAPSGEEPLAELAQLVALRDQEQQSHSRGTLELAPPPLLLPASLPAVLRDWVIDPADITLLRWPNHSLQELGKGARWGVAGTAPRRRAMRPCGCAGGAPAPVPAARRLQRATSRAPTAAAWCTRRGTAARWWRPRRLT